MTTAPSYIIIFNFSFLFSIDVDLSDTESTASGFFSVAETDMDTMNLHSSSEAEESTPVAQGSMNFQGSPTPTLPNQDVFETPRTETDAQPTVAEAWQNWESQHGLASHPTFPN